MLSIRSRGWNAFAVSLVALAAAGQAMAQSVWPTPVFDAPVVVAHNNSDSMIEVLDFDGDGDREAVAVRINVGAPVAYLTVRTRALQGANPGLYFAGNVSTPDGSDPFSAVGELFAPDGRDDLVVGVGRELSIFYGASLSRDIAVISPALILGTAIGDYNGDGLGDVAVLTPQALTVHFAQPGFTLSAPVSIALPAGSGSLLLQAEATGDSWPDLAVVGDRVDLYTFAGGSPAALASIPVNLPHPMPVAGDIDSDGDEDIVVFDEADYVVLRRTSPTTFAPEPSVVGGPATHLYDVDGDGDLDGACCSGGGTLPPVLYQAMTFRVSINNGGVFAPAYEMNGIGGWHLAGVVDVNKDGFEDLVSGRAIYFARQSLGVPPHADGPAGVVSPNSVADLDADGDPDWLTDPAALHANRGDGTATLRGLTLLQPPAAGTFYAPPVVAGDFDGDGDEDLIVEVRDGTGAIGTRLLLQRGPAFADGGAPLPGFVTLSPWLGTDSGRCVVADLDGDGDLDLVANSKQAPLWAHLWLNDGRGSFAFGRELVGEQVVAVHDVTGDGLPDLLVSDGRLRLRRGGASGFATTDEPLTVASYPYFNQAGSFDPLRDTMACADFDGDGRIDIVAGERVASGACFPVLLLGTGVAPAWFTPDGGPGGLNGVNGAEPCRILAGDVDGDGNQDVIVSNPFNAGWNGSGVAFGLGGRRPTFDSSRTLQFLAPIRALADVDGDGDLDGLGPKVITNRIVEGAGAGRRLQWGAATSGPGGVTLCLGAAATGRVGDPLDVRVSGAVGQAWGLLAIGARTRAVPMFGGTSWIEPIDAVVFTANGAAGVAGDGRATIGFGPIPASLLGLTFQLQALSDDAGVPASVVLSNAMTLTIGG